jgi:hypothetical protein
MTMPKSQMPTAPPMNQAKKVKVNQWNAQTLRRYCGKGADAHSHQHG